MGRKNQIKQTILQTILTKTGCSKGVVWSELSVYFHDKILSEVGSSLAQW